MKGRFVNTERFPKGFSKAVVGQQRWVEVGVIEELPQRDFATGRLEIIQHTAHVEREAAEASIRANSATEVAGQERLNCLLDAANCKNAEGVDRINLSIHELGKQLVIRFG